MGRHLFPVVFFSVIDNVLMNTFVHITFSIFFFQNGLSVSLAAAWCKVYTVFLVSSQSHKIAVMNEANTSYSTFLGFFYSRPPIRWCLSQSVPVLWKGNSIVKSNIRFIKKYYLATAYNDWIKWVSTLSISFFMQAGRFQRTNLFLSHLWLS